MNEASEQLENESPEEAAEQQEEAYEELQEAREAIDEELSEMREQQRDALLAKLIGMFQEMLDEQRLVTRATAELHEARQEEDAEWGRAEQLRCSQLADREAALESTGEQALTFMLENSSPVVFPRIVKDINADLDRLEGRLKEEKTGEGTAFVQDAVERALVDLIEALEQAQGEPPPPSESEPQEGGGGGSPPPPPLISALAELKLLRNRQVRVNEGTKMIHERSQNEGIDADLTERIDVMTGRQQDVHTMTHELVERLMQRGRPDSEEEGEDSNAPSEEPGI